jgi:predicted nucleic acid-binding Zn ribbon protein
VSEERQAEAPTAAASCPTCGEPVDPHQLVCLNCGGRVALRERRSRTADPLVPVAVALIALVAIGAGLFGFAVSELTSDEGDGSEQAARPAPPEAATEGPSVVSGSEQTTRTSPETAPSEQPAPPRKVNPNAVPGWPRGERAYTVVLVTSSDGPAARRVARRARGSGLEAGLIRSDPYNLGSGLWIVFTGRFDTREGAVRQAAGLQDRYPGAYPQLVQRSQ